MAHRIVYADLAAYLRELSVVATCSELVARLERYPGTDEDMRADLVAAVRACPPSESWLTGLMAICEVLRQQNPRFESAIFVDDLVLYDR